MLSFESSHTAIIELGMRIEKRLGQYFTNHPYPSFEKEGKEMFYIKH